MVRLKKGALPFVGFFASTLAGAAAVIRVEYFDGDYRFWNQFNKHSKETERNEPKLHKTIEKSFSDFVGSKPSTGAIIENTRNVVTADVYVGLTGNVLGLLLGAIIPQGVITMEGPRWLRVTYGALGLGLILKSTSYLYITLYSYEQRLAADKQFFKHLETHLFSTVKGTRLEDAKQILSDLAKEINE